MNWAPQLDFQMVQMAIQRADGTSEPQTITVLQNIRVLATGHRIEHSATGEPLNASVVPLLVSPEDSEKLGELGKGAWRTR
jgi:Flp pilus assembly protein CpaB